MAQLALWTAGIVVCTLMVNAPLMPYLLRWTRLNAISDVKTRMRGKAARALLRYTKTAIDDLQHDEDEMLRGGPPMATAEGLQRSMQRAMCCGGGGEERS
jgi:hypothetical protein